MYFDKGHATRKWQYQGLSLKLFLLRVPMLVDVNILREACKVLNIRFIEVFHISNSNSKLLIISSMIESALSFAIHTSSLLTL